jgi:glutamate/tyrosine decarboxylase-like PLP-dependent enzyme
LAWIAELVGFPETAGGVFVTGGTAGNLSALLAARFRWRQRAAGAHDKTRGLMITCQGAHSSVASAARAIDADVLVVTADESGRMHGKALRAEVDALSDFDRDRTFAVVATAGTTNAGIIDDLAGIAEVTTEAGMWLHVDGAYGGAALAAPSVRDRFSGIEHADSFIVDPHKWLFAPFDCCALLYREPNVGRAAHTQHAEYLDVLHAGDVEHFEWNPSDFAHHLSRRARGLPFWFSLATYGTEAYRDAIETALDVTRKGARLIDSAPHVELILEPELSVLLFRRSGWGPADYDAWSNRLLDEGTAFVTPTSWQGEVVLRLCIINPLTSVDDIQLIVDSLA